jgi:Arc/MetJ family transcription regulator
MPKEEVPGDSPATAFEARCLPWRQIGPACGARPRYTVRMKRTNLVLDEHLLAELTRVSGERTYSGAVTKAMEAYLRRHKAGRIFELAGSGLWEGDLSEMRRDATEPGQSHR